MRRLCSNNKAAGHLTATSGAIPCGQLPAKQAPQEYHLQLSTAVGIYIMSWLLQASQIFGIPHSPCLMLPQDDGSGPVCDGVFRALPDGQSEAGKVGVAPKRGLWTATISLAGETYQAFFDTADAATEALNAAGFCA